MEVAGPIIRALLVGVFAFAGVAKLADPAGSRKTMTAFGLPTSAAIAVPLAELAVAVLLVFDATAGVGAVGAIALLAAYSAGIARALGRGERPDCRCFGRLTSTPVGPDALVRNMALAGLALIVAISA